MNLKSKIVFLVQIFFIYIANIPYCKTSPLPEIRIDNKVVLRPDCRSAEAIWNQVHDLKQMQAFEVMPKKRLNPMPERGECLLIAVWSGTDAMRFLQKESGVPIRADYLQPTLRESIDYFSEAAIDQFDRYLSMQMQKTESGAYRLHSSRNGKCFFEEKNWENGVKTITEVAQSECVPSPKFQAWLNLVKSGKLLQD